jgi:peptide/nickel transport system substrate-binding protein
MDSSLVTRRRLLRATTTMLAAATALPLTRRGAAAQESLLDELVIDLSSEPATLDPILTYDVNGWSVVHAIYDAPVQYGPTGEIELLVAEGMELVDPLTLEVRLRPGVTFHNGAPLTAESIRATIAAIAASDSQIKGNFATIAGVEVVDELTARLLLSAPSPWLPAQLAVWLACLPPAELAAGTLAETPVGTGPYRFVSWERGQRIVLEANPDYPADSPKGRPIAKRVVYRFVPEATTRVADLLSGTSHLVRALPVTQVEAVTEAGAQAVVQPLSGNAWIRIATDVAPFSEVRVRQALNYAVDVESIIAALLGGHGRRLANFFVPNGLGYDQALAPYPYDPERAKALLAEAGLADGFTTQLAFTTSERKELVEAIAAQLAAVGVTVELVPQEIATFNGEWKEPAAPPLRFSTWRPMYDPFNLLNLVVAREGFLSRHANDAVDPLLQAAATETDPARRADLYRQLGVVLHEQPAAIYLWSLTSIYGVAASAPAWTPRSDDYILPTVRS